MKLLLLFILFFNYLIFEKQTLLSASYRPITPKTNLPPFKWHTETTATTYKKIFMAPTAANIYHTSTLPLSFSLSVCVSLVLSLSFRTNHYLYAANLPPCEYCGWLPFWLFLLLALPALSHSLRALHSATLYCLLRLANSSVPGCLAGNWQLGNW